jgi:ABC-type transporter Mla MlaB component
MIDTHRSGNLLEVEVHGSFNLTAKNMLEGRLRAEVTDLNIDLTECKFIDSEGIIFMYRWQNSGKGLELINPPEILFEIVELLELREHWDLNYITK